MKEQRNEFYCHMTNNLLFKKLANKIFIKRDKIYVRII